MLGYFILTIYIDTSLNRPGRRQVEPGFFDPPFNGLISRLLHGVSNKAGNSP